MSESQDKLKETLVLWFKNIDEALMCVGDNEEIREALVNISNCRQNLIEPVDLDVIANLAINNLRNIARLQFKDRNLFNRIIRVVFVSMAVTLFGGLPHFYGQLAKMATFMLRTNAELVDRELPMKFLSRDFFHNIKDLRHNFTDDRAKLSEVQYQLISLVIKTFPSNAHAASILAVEFFKLRKLTQTANPNVTKRVAQLQPLILMQFNCPEIFSFIEKPELEKFHSHCCDVIGCLADNPDLLNAAMCPVESENICVLLMRSIVRCPEANYVNPEGFDKCIQGMTALIVSQNLRKENFEFIETQIIDGILSNYFWRSFVCFHLFVHILVFAERSADAKRVIFFRSLAGSQSLSQAFLTTCVRLLINPNCCENDELRIISCKLYREAQHRFVRAFNSTKEQMTSDSYYELTVSLQLLAHCRTEELTRESVSLLCELIKLLVDCDWDLYSDLIFGLIDVTTSTEDEMSKMNLMSAWHPVLIRSSEKSVPAKLKLADLLISYIPIAKTKISLTQILTKEINKLLGDEDLTIRRAVVEKLSRVTDPYLLELSTSLIIDPEFQAMSAEEKQNLFANSADCEVYQEPKKLKQHDEQTESAICKKLKLILDYSEKLQEINLSTFERDVAQRIAESFSKVARKRKLEQNSQ